MILNNNNTHNSIAFNPITDDITYRGYAALAFCIWGDVVNGIEIKPADTVGKEEAIKKAYGLYSKSSKEDKREKEKTKKQVNRDHKTFKYKNIRLVDAFTGEVTKIFNNVLEASEFLGITDTRVNAYIRYGYIRDKKYKIEADLNTDYVKNSNLRKRVRAINVNTGFIKECESVQEASKVSGLNSVTIYINARDKKISRDGWKFEYLED